MRKNRVRFIQWRSLHSPWRHYGRWGCAEDVARTWARSLPSSSSHKYKRGIKAPSNLHHHRYGYEWRVGRESSHTAQVHMGWNQKGILRNRSSSAPKASRFTPSFSMFVILSSDAGRPLNVVLGIFLPLDGVVTLCQCFRIDWTPVGWWNGCSE